MSSKIKSTTDFFFKWMPLTLGFLWSLQAIYDIVLNQNLYSLTRPFPLPYLHSEMCAHSISIPLLFSLYVYCYWNLNEISEAMRVASSGVYVMFSMQFNGMFWALGDELVNGTGSPFVLTCLFILIVLLLITINTSFPIIKIKKKRLIIIVSMALVSYVIFYNSGFYEAWHLHSKVSGSYPDPHNWQWLLRAITGIYIPTAVVADRKKRGDDPL